jgi:flotillin
MEIAEAKRREAATEAQANAEIVAVEQTRRAKQAQILADQNISNSERELAQIRVANAALIAEAEAKRQDALAIQREAELRATQIAQASADAERLKIDAQAQAEAQAVRIREIAEANAESIRKVNAAILEGGEAYLRYRQLEMMPQIVPQIASALAQAKLITITGGEGGSAAENTTNQVSQVIQTMLAAQLVAKNGVLDNTPLAAKNGDGAA